MKEDKSKGKVEGRVSLTRLGKVKKNWKSYSSKELNKIVICEMDAIR